MTADAITSWLTAPGALPEAAQMEKALREWPWFSPLRFMEAAAQGELAYPEKMQARLSLYADHWLPVYLLLTSEAQEDELAYEPLLEANDVIEIEAEDVHEEADLAEAPIGTEPAGKEDKPLIQPLYTEDYFRFEGLDTPNELPQPEPPAETSQPQTLMVVMSFAEWLNHFKVKTLKEQEEAREKSALRSMWQQEKLAAAMEDEPEEIPDDVFEMAVNSITKEEGLVSEPLAQIYERQEKWGAAAEMYRKLALKYPSKSAYFAARAEAAQNQLK